ncbi:Sulfite reductase [NADPH] subunit beta, partial [Spiromyces aspiralis]
MSAEIPFLPFHSNYSVTEAVAHAVLAFSTVSLVATTDLLAPASRYLESVADGSATLPHSVVSIDPHDDFGSALRSLASRGVSALVPSSYLLRALPSLNSLARDRLPAVIHVFPPDTRRFCDLADSLAIRDCGCAVLCSSSVQEAHNLAAVAHLVAAKLSRPFIHIINLHGSRLTEPVAFRPLNLAKAPDAIDAFVSADLLPTTTGPPLDDHGDSTATHAVSEDLRLISAVESALALFSSSTSYDGGDNNNNNSGVVSYSGPADARVVFVTIGALNLDLPPNALVGSLGLRLYRPLPTHHLLGALPSSVEKIVSLEESSPIPSIWGPLFFDLAALLRHESQQLSAVLIDARTVRDLASAWTSADFEVLLSKVADIYTSENLNADELVIGHSAAAAPNDPSSSTSVSLIGHQDTADSSQLVDRINQLPYAQMLADTFKSRLAVVNGLNSKSIWGPPGRDATNPEFGFGKIAHTIHLRELLARNVSDLLADPSVFLSPDLSAALSRWLEGKDDPTVASVENAAAIVGLLKDELLPPSAASGNNSNLNTQTTTLVEAILDAADLLPLHSNWLIGADEWAYDLGNSGVHHLIASGLNINMLVLDTLPYSQRKSSSEAIAKGRKKDIGLYAMNYGNTYVASVAVYSSYTHVLQALLEADAFPGPSIVLAYLPSAEGVTRPSHSPIIALQESKLAVDSGYWPLYRWNPLAADDVDQSKRFILDSPKIRDELRKFLKRDNTLALLGRDQPRLHTALAESAEARETKKATATHRDVDQLLSGLQGPPLLVLFASDNGNAEETARRVERGGKRRGMTVRCMPMDEFEVDELTFEKTVVFCVSTAGQGEFPTNGREFWKALSSASINLNETQFAVFGLGDSHYWPREEDHIYYNKPGKDLDKKLVELGGRQLVSLHLGDDQDPDGWETGFHAWESKIWEALNLDVVEGVVVDEPQKITDEQNKVNSNYLRGTIREALEDESSGTMNEYDLKILKFHGSYGQDDRDLRPERLVRGEEKAYSFMIRVRLPAGVATPDQWLAMDRLADEYGNQTMKITTRQTFQLHGVLKRNLRATMRGINRALMDTIAACGDVNRNVVASANPHQAELHPEIVELARGISSHLLPKTSAYHEIWINDEQVAGDAVQDYEPLYGPAYLPRKFKVAIAIPPENDVDVFAYDLGYIAVLDERQENILGYNVVIGGGMGMTHNNKKTYPRLATALGYVPKDKAIEVGEKVMLVQRDHGDRSNRKHARLKYTVDDHGIDWYREQ